MKCISKNDLYYYDEKLDEFYFKEPYNDNDYIFLVQVFDEYHKNRISLYFEFDLFEIEHLFYFHSNCIIYLVNNKNLNIRHII